MTETNKEELKEFLREVEEFFSKNMDTSQNYPNKLVDSIVESLHPPL